MNRSITCVILFAVVLVSATGCMGPTKKGKEARESANRNFNLVRSKIDYDQAMQAFNRGQMLHARRLLETAMNKSPDEALYTILLGRICLETSQMESAITAFERAVELNPEIPDPRYFLGIVAERMKNSDEAAKRFLEAYELDQESAQYLTAAAEVLISAGRLAEAETILSRDSNRFRNNAAIHHLRGRISMMNGKWTDAVDSLRSASLIDDKDDLLLADYARAQFAAGHHASCMETLSELENRGETNFSKDDLKRLRTRCLVDSRRFKEAHRELCSYIEQHPDDVDAWIDLGLVCRSIGDNRRLRLAGRRIALINRNRFEGYFLLGCSFLEEEDYAKAIEFFSESTKIAPQRSETWLALGMSYEKSGKLVQAFRAYAKAENDHGQMLMTHVADDME